MGDSPHESDRHPIHPGHRAIIGNAGSGTGGMEWLTLQLTQARVASAIKRLAG
jgi:hypothetical protein